MVIDWELHIVGDLSWQQIVRSEWGPFRF